MHSGRLRQVAPDLWETSVDSPLPGLTTHAYLWRSGDAGNFLFYSVATPRDFEELDRLGGVAHQYLSHRDEAGPMLAALHDRFGTVLHTSAIERGEIERHRRPDVVFDRRGVDANGVEIVPTPGHTPGSTCFAVVGAEGRYLFVGDTVYRTPEGEWAAGYIDGISDRDALAATLGVLAGLRPDVVISSAFAGDHGVHQVGDEAWRRALDQARRSLRGDHARTDGNETMQEG